MSLRGELIEVSRLEERHKAQMFSLMSLYFCNMKKENFMRDLEEKRWAIVLFDGQSGLIKGFSTLMLLEQEIGGNTVKALYSGDTIIDRKYWGENELVKVWGRLAGDLIDHNDGIKLYWFLIAMGFRTYRYLPVYFYRYFPRHDGETPREIKLAMDLFARKKFGDDYDPVAGLIRRNTGAEYLAEGVSDITEARARNPHIRYFSEKNPGYKRGDELVCFTELSPENMKPRLRSIVTGGIKL
ncbi:MAG: hypothetical protein PHC68_09490 [Syntrophorhabdaceae bacterium]|jgi:hypothetical protein|nr:hypothetical protein [Syntrophorhabdaceae bacterium]